MYCHRQRLISRDRFSKIIHNNFFELRSTPPRCAIYPFRSPLVFIHLLHYNLWKCRFAFSVRCLHLLFSRRSQFICRWSPLLLMVALLALPLLRLVKGQCHSIHSLIVKIQVWIFSVQRRAIISYIEEEEKYNIPLWNTAPAAEQYICRVYNTLSYYTVYLYIISALAPVFVYKCDLTAELLWLRKIKFSAIFARTADFIRTLLECGAMRSGTNTQHEPLCIHTKHIAKQDNIVLLCSVTSMCTDTRPLTHCSYICIRWKTRFTIASNFSVQTRINHRINENSRHRKITCAATSQVINSYL